MYDLNYIFPDGSVITLPAKDWDERYAQAWLHSMVEVNPEVIFFFTVPSTDIWSD